LALTTPTLPTVNSATHTYRKHRGDRFGPIGDSGASGTIMCESDKELLVEISSKGGQGVTFGGGSQAESIGKGEYFPIALDKPIEVNIYKDTDLVESLVSFHPFCDQGLAVVLVDEAMIMLDKDKLNIAEEDIKLFAPKEKGEPL